MLSLRLSSILTTESCAPGQAYVQLLVRSQARLSSAHLALLASPAHSSLSPMVGVASVSAAVSAVAAAIGVHLASTNWNRDWNLAQ